MFWSAFIVCFDVTQVAQCGLSYGVYKFIKYDLTAGKQKLLQVNGKFKLLRI